jgi:hypothetical protein
VSGDLGRLGFLRIAGVYWSWPELLVVKSGEIMWNVIDWRMGV